MEPTRADVAGAQERGLSPGSGCAEAAVMNDRSKLMGALRMLFVVLGAAGALASTYWLMRIEDADRRAAQAAQLTDEAELMSVLIDGRVAALEEDLVLVSRSPAIAETLARLNGERAGLFDDAAQEAIRTTLADAMLSKPAFASMQLIAAFESGLDAVRVDRLGLGPLAGVAQPQDEAERKALWYADYVRGAVRAEPRVAMRSGVLREHAGRREGEIPVLRAAFAVHAADEVVPAVLVVSLDLRSIASEIATVGALEGRHVLADTQGDPLTWPGSGADGAAGSGESDGDTRPRLPDIRPLSSRGEAVAEVLAEMASEPGQPGAIRQVEGGLLHVRWVAMDAADRASLVLLSWQPHDPLEPLIWASTPMGAVSLGLAGLALTLGLVASLRRPAAAPVERAAGHPRRRDEPAAEKRRPRRLAPELQELQLEEAEFDLEAMAGEVLECLTHSGAIVTISCHEQLPRRLIADRDWLAPLVLWAGQVVVRAGAGEPVRIFLSGDRRGDRMQLRVRVQDEGGNVDLARFEPAVDSAGAYHLLAQMNGEVELVQGEGGGVSLDLFVPVRLPVAESA